MEDKLINIKKRYDELTKKISDPDIISQNKKYAKLAKEHSDLQPIVDEYSEFLNIKNEIADINNDLKIEKDESMLEFLEDELDSLKEKLSKKEDKLKEMLVPKDKDDEKDVVIEIRAGAGGKEASLFADTIMRMYLKFAEAKGWNVKVLDTDETDLNGLKSATFSISGKDVYSYLKFESGVHRVQRVPETETQGRIHTSTITVAVLPEKEEIDIEIDKNDLRIDTYRASGAGGQHVNTTDSAVRITHAPTGVVVQCQNERSQTRNRETAMKMLYTRLYDHLVQKKEKEYSDSRKIQVGTGDRSERIRTYNYPQGRITDHRINYSVYNFQNVLEGDLDELINKLKQEDKKNKMKD